MRVSPALKLPVALVALVLAVACTLPAGDPCCASDADCEGGARCFEDRCATLCDDGSQCAEGEACLADARVCARPVRAPSPCEGAEGAAP